MPANHKVAAILVAGGSGMRFSGSDGELPKQFQLMRGYPLYIWTISKLYKYGLFVDIVMTMQAQHIEKARSGIGEILPEGNQYIDVIAGGATRQESVYNALKHLRKKGEAEYVVIHDAVRPFLTTKMLDDAITTVTTRGACTIGTPVSDTLKKVAPDVSAALIDRLIDGLIIETVDRQNLYAVQTPQAAPLDTLLACHEEARKLNIGVTDDAAILEHFGHKVVIFPGQNHNIKITVGEDLRTGELLAPLFLPATPH